jgi:hypothetical protein
MISRLNKRVAEELGPGIKKLLDDLNLLNDYYSTLDAEKKERIIDGLVGENGVVSTGHLANTILNWTDPPFQFFLINKLYQKENPAFACSSFINYMFNHRFNNFTNNDELDSLNNEWIDLMNRLHNFRENILKYPSFKATKNHYEHTHFFFNKELKIKYGFIKEKKSYGRISFDPAVVNLDLIKSESPLRAKLVVKINWPLAIIASMITITEIESDKTIVNQNDIKAIDGSIYRLTINPLVNFSTIREYFEGMIRFICEGLRVGIDDPNYTWFIIKPNYDSARIIRDKTVGRPSVKNDFSTQLIKQLDESITLLINKKIIRRSRGRNPSYMINANVFDDLCKIGYFFTIPQYWTKPLVRTFYQNVFSTELIDLRTISGEEIKTFILDDEKMSRKTIPSESDIDEEGMKKINQVLHQQFLRTLGV